jgi:hypothetical protein
MPNRRRAIGRLFRSLISTLLLGVPLAAQIDIPITQIGPIRTLARNVNWQASGTSGVNNNYILTPSATNESLCLSIQNTSGATQLATLSFWGTEDQTVTQYQTNKTAWTLLGPTTGIALGNEINILNNQVLNIFVQINSQARVAVVISQSGSSATNGGATLLSVESPNSSGCGNMTIGIVQCPFMGTQSVSSGQTLGFVAPVANQRVYLCHADFSTSAANTTAGVGLILAAYPTITTGVCSGTQLTLWEADVSTVTLNPPWTFAGSPFIGGFLNSAFDTAGYGMCITNNLSVSVSMNYTYAQF